MKSTSQLRDDPHAVSIKTLPPPSSALIVPLFCISLLATFTMTTPTDSLAATYGTKSILPREIIVAGKSLARAITIGSLTCLLPFIWHRSGRGSVILFALPWFAFAGWGVLSTAWSPLPRITLGQAGGFCCLLLVSVVIGILCSGIPDISKILGWLSALLAFISGALIFLHYAVPEVNALTKWALGIFHSTNACGSASLAITILLAVRLVWGFPWARRFWIPGILLHLAVLVIGLNRTSMGVLLLVGSLISLLYGKQLAILIMCAAITFVGTTYVIVDPGLNLLTSTLGTTETFLSQGQTRSELATFTGRTEMWEAMWKSFLDSPWRGHGYFVTSRTGEIYVWHEWGNWTAHNFILQLLVTSGIVGALLFAVGAVSIGLGLLMRARTDPGTKDAVTFCFLIAVWHTLFGLMDSSILGAVSPEGCVFACVLGIAFSLVAKPGQFNYEDGLPEPHRSRSAAPVDYWRGRSVGRERSCS